MHAGRAPSRCREGGGPAAAACSSVAAAGASVSPLRASSPAARNWCCSAPLPSAPPPWAEAASGPSASCVHALPPASQFIVSPPRQPENEPRRLDCEYKTKIPSLFDY